jgi:hypothetical protein
MNPLSAFKKPAPPAASPARAAFRAQMAAHRAKERQRLKVLAQDAATAGHREASDAAIARVATLRAAIDQAIADSVYGDGAAPDLDARRRELAEAEAEAERLAPIARVAEIGHRRFTSQAAELTREVQALSAPIPRLLHAALFDDALDELAAEFREKEEAFREVHRRVFIRALAADKLAMVHQLSVFRDSGTYLALHISAPSHPAYQRGPADGWQAKLARDADVQALDAEADALINQMLTEEP